jgi:fucose 4-O-acetylase-like acetyltransferase
MRGLLILLVTLGHALQWTANPGVRDTCFGDPLFVAIYLFHVPLFFVISGLLLGRSEREGADRHRILRRLLRMAVPAFVWFVLTFLGLRLSTGLLSGKLNTTPPAWSTLLYGLSMHGWYVWCLCAFNAFLLLPGHSLRLRAGLVLIACLALTLLPDGELLFLFPYAFAFLAPGYLVGRGLGGIAWPMRGWLRSLLLLGSAVVFLTWDSHNFIYFKGWSVYSDNFAGILLRFASQALVTVTAADLLWLLSRHLNSRLLAWLGDRTLFIYLSQNLFILLSQPLWQGLPLGKRLVLWPLCVLLTLLTCAIGLGLERLASRHRLSAFLLGANDQGAAIMRH